MAKDKGNHVTTSPDWRTIQPGHGLLAVTANLPNANSRGLRVVAHRVLAVRLTANGSGQVQYEVPSWLEDRWLDGESVLALTFGLANEEWVEQAIERLQQMQGGAWQKGVFH